MSGQRLVKADVACELLGCTRDKLTKLAKDGKISSMRLPTGRLFDVDEFIARGNVPEKAPPIRGRAKVKQYCRIALIAAGLALLIGLGSSIRQPNETTVGQAVEPLVEAELPAPVKKPVLSIESRMPKPEPKKTKPCPYWPEFCS